MKPKLAFAWFVVSLALTALLVVNWRGSSKQKQLLEKLQIQVEKLDQLEKSAQARATALDKESLRLRGELRAAEIELNSARLALQSARQSANAAAASGQASAGHAPQPQGAGNMGAMLSNMMKDPEMRKVMEQQQSMGLEMVYGSLYKQLQLDPEQEKEFREALLAMQMTNMIQGGAMFDPSNTNRAELARKLAEDRNVAEEKIKDILGDEKFSQFQDYTQTLGERMMLDQFSKRAAVSPEQSEQLLNIIREEKKNLQVNLGNQAVDPARDWQQMLQSGEAAERLIQQQDAVNERVLERAHQVLTPEQMEDFRPFMTNQAAMQRVGLKMARQMFQNSSTPAPPTP